MRSHDFVPRIRGTKSWLVSDSFAGLFNLPAKIRGHMAASGRRAKSQDMPHAAQTSGSMSEHASKPARTSISIETGVRDGITPNLNPKHSKAEASNGCQRL